MVSVYKQDAVPFIVFSSVKGNFEGEKEVEDTMLDLLKPFPEGFQERDGSSSTPTAGGAAKHEVVEEPSLGDKFSSVVTEAGGGTMAEVPRVRKESSVPQPRGNNNVFTIHSYPMKTKEASEPVSCLQGFLHPSQKPEIICTDSSKEFINACQDLQWKS